MRFKFGSHFSIIVLSLLTLTSACIAQPRGKNPSVCDGQSKTFLWETKSPTNTIYLLGSIHVLKEEDYPLNPRLDKAFEESEVIVLESNFDSVAEIFSDPAVLQNNILLPKGKTLDTYLSQATYELVKKKSEELQLPLQEFQIFRPWFVATMVTSLGLIKLGFDTEQGVDFYFFTRAKQEDKKILELETAQDSLELFNQLPQREEEQFLLQSFIDLETLKNDMNKIVDAWKLGETEQLESLFFESMKEFPTLQEKLIVQRNKNWLPKIKTFFNQNEDYLVIVGAAHLVGQDSLIELLEKEGYSFKQLSCVKTFKQGDHL